MSFQLKTPVALIAFNRPETTKRVFAEIAKAKPPILLVIANGPRKDHPEDNEKCVAVRSIIDNVDWDCNVLTNYSDINIGCFRCISSGLSWVFSKVEDAIILEDDCIPHPTFFQFCEELLDKYRNDERIAMISGDNFQFGRKRTDYSYYFSRYPHIWGWASWRRAWNYYDDNWKLWSEIRDGGWLKDLLEDRRSVWYWKMKFENDYKGRMDIWDYQWTFSCWIQNMLTIIPNVNLISNIGFGSDALHTKEKTKLLAMETEPMIFPLAHPPYIIRDSVADSITEKLMFSHQPLLAKGLREIKQVVRTYVS